MSKNKLIIIGIIFVCILMVMFLFIPFDDESDYDDSYIPTDDEEEIILDNDYEGINTDGTLNGEILVNNHFEAWNDLDSYDVFLSEESDVQITIRKNNDKINYHKKNNTLNDIHKYYDGNKTFVREGSSITELNYYNTNESIIYENYYNKEKIINILNNVKIDDINETDDNIKLVLKHEDRFALRDLHNVDRISTYNVVLNISQSGLITELQVVYVEETNTSQKTHNIEYKFNTPYVDNISEPHWINKAK